MIRGPICLSIVLVGLATFGAQAAIPSGERQVPRPAQTSTSDAVRLAQYGDVEIYYDEYGRRIVRDSYTGEIIAVERPRRSEREFRRDDWGDRRSSDEERYYLDDPRDMERLRQRKMEEFGTYSERAPIDDYRRYPAEPYPPRGGEVFPEAPRPDVYDDWQSDTVERSPADRRIERRPLDNSPNANDPFRNEDRPAIVEPVPAPDAPSSIAEAPLPGPPNVMEGAIDPSLRLGAREDVAALQILLDRRGASPGVIDGRFGSNVDKAIVAYRAITGLNLRSTDTDGIKKALAETGGDPFTEYTITAADAAGPFVASVPADYGEKAKLERMSYTSVPEMLAERFHMDEGYLKVLNPQANFSRVGTVIRVANIGRETRREVSRIVADKSKKQVFAYDASNKLVAAYPATIGSSSTPSPTGTHLVTRVALDPNYTYNPNLNFKQGNNDKILTIPPGPNGPVGNVWIALDKPTYGIHGTPDPSKIGKTESHGCVRLTNWDAQELAKLVKPGVPVEFID